MKVITSSSLRRAALSFLARREHSIFELRQKLFIKFPEASENFINKVLTTLQEENLQSDSRYAESYTRYRKGRGFGYRNIKREMQKKKVDPNIFEKHLYTNDSDWIRIISAVVKKKIRSNSTLIMGSKEYLRLIRFLQSRGFLQWQIDIAIRNSLH
ncbi:MAG: regulatory protein RecX [Gammaproteobacteria bacterium]|nr:regulatory protein RecX [Gammaproteobacteria bacterium]